MRRLRDFISSERIVRVGATNVPGGRDDSIRDTARVFASADVDQISAIIAEFDG